MQIRQLPVPQLPVALLAHLFLQLPSPFSPSKSFLLPSFTFSHRNRFRPPTFTFTPLVFGPLMCGSSAGIHYWTSFHNSSAAPVLSSCPSQISSAMLCRLSVRSPLG